MTLLESTVTTNSARAWFALIKANGTSDDPVAGNQFPTSCDLDKPVHNTDEVLNLARPNPLGRAQARTRLINLVAQISNRCTCEVAIQNSDRGPRVLGVDDLSVSISHSGSCSAVVVCKQADVGIDIEDLERRLDSGAIARRFFTRKEQSYLDKLSTERRHRHTLLLWTIKEAALKATGSGLQQPLPRIERFANGHPKRVTTFDGRVLWVRNLELPKRYVGSIVSSEALGECLDATNNEPTEETAWL